jgi:hypothetical protein
LGGGGGGGGPRETFPKNLGRGRPAKFGPQNRSKTLRD